MTTPIRVHQIYYLPEQLSLLDPAFLPYNNAASPAPEQREYWVFREAYRSGLVRDGELTGFLSWKFGRKSQLKGEQFVKYIEQNPGYDAYFVNPFPITMGWRNVWVQGDVFHPGLLDFTQSLLSKLGYSVSLADLEMTKAHFAYCNYWVGTKAFWDRYMAFTGRFYDYLLGPSTIEEKSFLWKRGCYSINAPYFPFLFERLFSTLLSLDPAINALPYFYSDEELTRKYPQDQIHMAKALVAQMKSDSTSEVLHYREWTQHELLKISQRNIAKTRKAAQQPEWSLNRHFRRSLDLARNSLTKLF